MGKKRMSTSHSAQRLSRLTKLVLFRNNFSSYKVSRMLTFVTLIHTFRSKIWLAQHVMQISRKRFPLCRLETFAFLVYVYFFFSHDSSQRWNLNKKWMEREREREFVCIFTKRSHSGNPYYQINGKVRVKRAPWAC